jgi:ribonuclease HI
MGNRSELVRCADITLAEHLALLMAMHDAESKLSGRVVFRVDSAAVLDRLRRWYPELDEAKRQIAGLLERHSDWSLVLVEKERNWPAHNLANRPLRDDA